MKGSENAARAPRAIGSLSLSLIRSISDSKYSSSSSGTRLRLNVLYELPAGCINADAGLTRENVIFFDLYLTLKPLNPNDILICITKMSNMI